jgi:transcriptional regulator with XRE-family HTH domain
MTTAARVADPLALRLGRIIQRLREAQGMKQEVLAAEVGYTNRSTIAQIENGWTLPSVDKVLKIAHVLGVHPGVLLDEHGVEGCLAENVMQRLLEGSQIRRYITTLRNLADELEQFATTH